MHYLQDRNLVTFALFLVFAAILWFGHSLNSARDKKITIAIEYIGIPDSVIFKQQLPTSFQVDLRDKGSRLREYHSATFPPIVIDLSKQLEQEEGVITISSDIIRQRVSEQKNGTTQLQQIRPEKVTIEYCKQHCKHVPIHFNGKITMAPQYQAIGDIVIQPDSIQIFGAKNVLSNIQRIETEETILTEVTSLSTTVGLVPISNVRFSQDKVNISINTEQFTEKVFNVPIQTLGVPAGETLRLFPQMVDVTIRVGISHFNDITQNDVQVVCNYPKNTSPSSQNAKLPLSVSYSSKHITAARLSPATVEYIIEK